jgi:hypothetical protein
VFTAGCRSGRPVREEQIKATEYHGVVNTLSADHTAGFGGRFLYMTSSGISSHSFWSASLNLYKGNTLRWRGRAEDAIRTSGLPYTIIRAGMLLNRPPGTHAIRLTQKPLPLSPFYRIAREDVAEAFVTALDHPRGMRTTFEIVWDGRAPRESWVALMQNLQQEQTSNSVQ